LYAIWHLAGIGDGVGVGDGVGMGGDVGESVGMGTGVGDGSDIIVGDSVGVSCSEGADDGIRVGDAVTTIAVPVVSFDFTSGVTFNTDVVGKTVFTFIVAVVARKGGAVTRMLDTVMVAVILDTS
jgi:hypothetical protein